MLCLFTGLHMYCPLKCLVFLCPVAGQASDDGTGNEPEAGCSMGNKTPMARDAEPALLSPRVRIPVVRNYRRTMIKGPAQAPRPLYG